MSVFKTSGVYLKFAFVELLITKNVQVSLSRNGEEFFKRIRDQDGIGLPIESNQCTVIPILTYPENFRKIYS